MKFTMGQSGITRLILPFAALTSIFLVIFSLSSFAEGPGPKVQFDRTVIDYGQIPVGKIVKPRFSFKNVGSVPLKIINRLVLGKFIQAKALEGC
ncbi:hypothetical protein ACFLQ0_01835 [Nitrospinota bacterium]